MSGVSMKVGAYDVLVDAETIERFSGMGWFVARKDRAFRVYCREKGTGKKLSLARLIVGAPTGMMVDHINRNSLDNRMCNLRLCTNSQNQMNRRKLRPLLSKFKGVRPARGGRFSSHVRKDGKRLHLGTFQTEEEAARAYDKAVIDLFGDFACTNEMLGLFEQGAAACSAGFLLPMPVTPVCDMPAAPTERKAAPAPIGVNDRRQWAVIHIRSKVRKCGLHHAEEVNA